MGAKRRPGSTWSVRTSLDKEFSTRQLNDFAEWGLIEREDQGWATNTAARLAVIREVGHDVRSLPRRVLRIYATKPGFPIPPDAFHQALTAIAPTIQRGIRKLTLIAQARAAMNTRSQGSEIRPGALPRQSDWSRLLAALPAARVAQYQVAWAYIATEVLPAYGREVDIDLEPIPVEERIVMVAVLDITQPDRRPGPPSFEA